MKELFDSIPDSVAPESSLEGAAFLTDLLPADDHDVVRPSAEEELAATQLARGHAFRMSALGKHLIWTFGPHHRDLGFMLQLRMELEGDHVVSVDAEVGWLHQGLEKALERTPLIQSFPLVERLMPANPIGYLLGWLTAVERLVDVEAEVPERARLWRTVLAEVSRILEHLRVLSALVRAHSDRRAQRAFVDAGRRVAALLDLASFADGTRVPHQFGGLSAEPAPSTADTLRSSLAEAVLPAQQAGLRLLENASFVDGMTGLGAIPWREALLRGFTGPVVRAAGFRDDIRLCDPYGAYHSFSPVVSVEADGDALARFRVRLEEISTSAMLVTSCVAALAHCPPERVAPGMDERLATLPNDGLATASVEIPSGELSVLVASHGGTAPTRAAFRGPSYLLVAELGAFLEGAALDDVVPILRGLGLCGTEIDR